MKTPEEESRSFEELGGVIIKLASNTTSQEQLGRDVAALVARREIDKYKALNNRVNAIEEKLGEAGFSIDGIRKIIETQAKTRWFREIVNASLSTEEVEDLRVFLNAMKKESENLVPPPPDAWRKLTQQFELEGVEYVMSPLYIVAYIGNPDTLHILRAGYEWLKCYLSEYNNIYFFMKAK